MPDEEPEIGGPKFKTEVWTPEDMERQRQYVAAVRSAILVGLEKLMDELGKFEMTCIGGLGGQTIHDVLYRIAALWERPGKVEINLLHNAVDHLTRAFTEPPAIGSYKFGGGEVTGLTNVPPPGK